MHRNGKLRPLPDYLRRGLKVVFVGYNPGRRSATVGHYYAGRGNQFWDLLSDSGLVPERLTFRDDARSLDFGMGFTDIVKRPSRGARNLTTAASRRGCARLGEKIRHYRPQAMAFVGKGVYERFAGRKVAVGAQSETVFGARVFVLLSTSGANARPRPEKLYYFCELARWLKPDSRAR